MAIKYISTNPERVVSYSPRTAESEPRAWTVAPNPKAHEEFQADLQKPGGGVASMVRTVTAEGLRADVAASMWSRYGEVREAVAEHPGARWRAWAAGRLAVQGAVDAPAATKSQVLLAELAREERSLADQKMGDLHPVAAAMRRFMYEQVQLASMNGSTPPAELLPPAAYADPVDIVDMVTADLAQQTEQAA